MQPEDHGWSWWAEATVVRGRLAPLGRIAAMVVCVLFVATLVRGTTIELNQSVGRVWPFSLARCAAPDTPGCDLSGVRQHPTRMGAGTCWCLPPV
jgi:hypothetical protein